MKNSIKTSVKAFTLMLLLALLSQQFQVAYAAPQEQPLTNADVVNLVKVGLGDDVVIAKVKEAANVSFQLDTDGLLKLKKDGVNERIITAMLDRNSIAKKAPASNITSIRLLTKNGEVSLDSIAGSMSTTFAYVTHLNFANYPGKASTVRITDRSPKIVIASQSNPTGRYYVVKTEPDKDTRSLKIGSSGKFRSSSHGVPDNDWVLPYTVVEKSAGVWEVALNKELEKGEYGVWSRGQFDRGGSPTGVLYDFGVD